MKKNKLAKNERKDIKKLYKEKRESFFKEFKKFISRGNIIDLAVGLIIGSAFTAIVTALTQGIIMPWVGYLIGDFDLSTVKYVLVEAVIDSEGVITKPEVAIAWGNLLQKIIDFLLISLILFMTLKVVVSVSNKIAMTHNYLKNKEKVSEELPKVISEEEVIKEPSTNELLIEIRDLLKQNASEKTNL